MIKIRITADRLLDIIQCFYLNKTLTEEEQEMINDLIDVASDHLEIIGYDQLSLIRKYEEAMKIIVESEPHGEEDEAMLLSSLKTYIQGVLDDKW